MRIAVNQTYATIFGGFILCGWPLLFFAIGVYYAKYGLPVILRWRGFGKSIDDDDIA